ncbi:MAG: GGDEF domain-containing protein, partial [Dehalococcoidia bacterium]|nr:GGDEF domain-containing protein [Dehalococcoidia bacterium]
MSQDFMLGTTSRAPQIALGELARPTTPIPGTMKCADVERLLVRNSSPSSLIAIRSDGRPLLVERLSFLHKMAGPVGFGRMLYHERPVQEILPVDNLVMSAHARVSEAFELLLTRSAADRFQDIIVEFPDHTFGLLEATHLLERVAELNADAALHDPLTGLGNRTLLMESIEAALGSREVWLALLFVDLDRFKVVNDGLGHDAGDMLLKTIAERIRRVVRDRGLAARLGGDEFAIALQGASAGDLEDCAESLALEITEVVRAPVSLSD